MMLDDVQSRLDTLVGALDGHDAGAIIAATEELATAVILFRGAGIPRGSEQRAELLIGKTLRQLEAAGAQGEMRMIDEQTGYVLRRYRLGQRPEEGDQFHTYSA